MVVYRVPVSPCHVEVKRTTTVHFSSVDCLASFLTSRVLISQVEEFRYEM